MMTELEQLQIEHACTKLINRFAILNDAMRYDELAELFTVDGSFARPTDPDNFVNGRDNILQAFKARPTDRITRHVITNIDVEVLDENSAHSVCYAVLYTGNTDNKAEKFGIQANPTQFIGEFHDEFTRTGDGWKIQRRSGNITFST